MQRTSRGKTLAPHVQFQVPRIHGCSNIEFYVVSLLTVRRPIANGFCSDANNLPKHSVRLVTIKRKKSSDPVKTKSFGPLTYVAWLGCALSALLLGLSIHLRDGMSILSVVLLSLLSSVIGLGNYWTLKLTERKTKNHHGSAKENLNKAKDVLRTSGNSSKKSVAVKDNKSDGGCDIASVEQGRNEKALEDHVPPGDVVIRYPKGSFLVVRCHENVARELYFAPEEIDYLIKDAWIYRLLSLVGTMMLMGGVIALANARIESQIAWAGSYMLLGSAYWIVAALPPKVHWDTSSYEVKQEALSDSIQHTKSGLFSRSNKYPYSKSESFTMALWKAVVASQDTTWVRRTDHCPATSAWDKWLEKARSLTDFKEPMTKEEKDNQQENDQRKDSHIETWRIPPWDPVGSLQLFMKEHKEEVQKQKEEERKKRE